MSPHKSTRRGLARLRRDDSGVAAVEFSLLAPVLFFAGLAAVDLGMAITERMTVDHVLRSGATRAMAEGADEDKIEQVLRATAKKNFAECEVADGDGSSVGQKGDCIDIAEPQKRFACPDDPDTAVADPAVCGGDYYTFYRLSATKTYVAMILPDISFSPAIEVQVR